MTDICIAGAGMTRFGKFLDRGVKSLAGEAVASALSDARTDAADVGAVFFANSMAGLMSGQESIRGQVALQETALAGKPIANVENACASGSTAFHLATLSVASGEVEVAVVVGAEKLYHEERDRPLRALMSAIDVERVEEIRQRLGSSGDSHSLFMDVYAEMAKRFAATSEASARDFAQVAVKNHEHGARNPHAQYRSRVTLEEVLESRVIVDPLTLLMCSPIGDGAAALVVTSRSHADRVGVPPVRVLASVLGSGEPGRYGEVVPQTARRAYERAAVGPGDLDVVELHDATAPAELILYEQLGLAAEGEAAKALWAGDTTLGGRVPVNPSGGLLSKGHPVGASGCAQLVELADQLRSRAGDRQVDGARVGLAENAGGYLDPDVAACVVTILAA